MDERRTIKFLRSYQTVAGPHQHGLDVSFSVGFSLTNQLKDAIGLLPETAWTVAVDAAGEPRPVHP
jgi:hypothetical protein